jgi:SAM-dependent methyltransferase
VLRVSCPITALRSYPGDGVFADHSIHFVGVEVLEAVPVKILIQPSVCLEYAFHLLGDIRGKTILDLGCGKGENLIPLAKRGGNVIGIDISPELVRLAEARIRSSGVKADVAVGSAYETGLPDESVDPPGIATTDRVFVIGVWYKEVPFRAGGPQVATINGNSWPSTERFTFNVGETVRWRWLNLSVTEHAMHLHGFYFHLDGAGDGERFTSNNNAAERPLIVTRFMGTGQTFDMTWVPQRAGRWLFHCQC